MLKRLRAKLHRKSPIVAPTVVRETTVEKHLKDSIFRPGDETISAPEASMDWSHVHKSIISRQEMVTDLGEEFKNPKFTPSPADKG